MITNDNPDGTQTTVFGFTHTCGVDLKPSDTDEDFWTLTFYDDGDPVILKFVPSWQLDAIIEQYANAKARMRKRTKT